MLGSIALCALAAAPAPPKKIAILDLERAGVEATLAETLSLLIPTQVRARVPGAQVTSAAEVQTMLGFERQRQLLGCSNKTECMAEIGNALGVDELVAGKVGRVGETFVLELRRISTQLGHSLGSVTRMAKGSAESLLDSVPGAVGELFPNEADAPVRADVTSAATHHPTWSYAAMGGGAVLLVGGTVGAVWGGSVAQKVAAQQSGGPLQVTRQDARTAQAVYAASWVVGIVGLGAAAVGVWGFYAGSTSVQVSAGPTPTGWMARCGGTF